MKTSVLDDGFVQYIDHMGNDHAVVQAARTSYVGVSVDSDAEKDERLLRYLMRHKHWTPFEMCILKIGIRIPMDAWRQFVRHRLFSINEYSTRYQPAIDSRSVASEWRAQSTNNKQGSNGLIADDVSHALSFDEARLHSHIEGVYQNRLKQGVAREQARKDLPLSTYTEAIVECDLRGWLHFLGLRMDPHAQLEIRQYANAIHDMIVNLFPISAQAFEDYHLNALTLTACDIQALTDPSYKFPTKREADEFEAKRERLKYGLKGNGSGT